MSSTGENVVRIEAEALLALAERLAGPMQQSFERAVDLLHRCTARVVVTGMGKSGIIAQKIAATLSSTGTPSLFMHPAEALHGDLGMVATGDVVIALSSSGETEELLKLLAKIKRIGDALISFTCDLQSTLAQASDVALDCSVPREGCSLGLAPTASTTAMLALGDAVAVALSERRGFKEEDFAELHPGGKLGKRLMRVSELMHAGDAANHTPVFHFHMPSEPRQTGHGCVIAQHAVVCDMRLRHNEIMRPQARTPSRFHTPLDHH